MNTLQGINTYTGAMSPVAHNHQRWSRLQRNCPALSYRAASKTPVICLSSYSPHHPFYLEDHLPSPSKPSPRECDIYPKGSYSTMSPAFMDAIKKVSHAVVGLSSRKGEHRMQFGSGTIIRRDGIIITSAIHKNCVFLEANDMVDVTTEYGTSLEGTILYADTRCNIAVIKITHKTSLTVAVKITHKNSIPVAELGNSLDVRLGDPMFVLDRDGICCNIAALGKFSGQHCGGPFQEFLKSNYKSGRIVNGGPVVNLHGEVIGVNFFDDVQFSLFVPIGIISKCLEQLKKFGTIATDADADADAIWRLAQVLE